MSNIQEFRHAFKLDESADIKNAATAIEAVSIANQVASSFLLNIDPKDESDGFRIHSLINLLGRTYEHTQAMLVALSTGSPASAEALGRVVVEGSINLMYLATLGNSSTLVMFFRSWLKEHERKLSEWKSRIQTIDHDKSISKMIEARADFVAQLNKFLDAVELQCSIEVAHTSFEWPKSVYKRFETLNRVSDYYESYHRLSGSSHLTGEDTLIWLLSLNLPEETQEKIGYEAWAYSIMMTQIASMFFVESAAACAISYGRKNNNDLQDCRRKLQKAIFDIAKEAGVPVPN